MNHTLDAGLSRLSGHPASRWLNERGPTLAVLALTLFIGWKLAGIVWSFFPDRIDSPIAGASLNSDTKTSSIVSTTDVQPIVDAHIFGIATEDSTDDSGTVVVNEDVTITNQPLVLRGTLAANSEENAIAIIAEGREENVFRLDETIRRGVTLHAVQTGQVILNVNGKLEALQLPEQASAPATSPARAASRSRASANTQPSVTQVLTNNASNFAQIISPRPYFVGGQQRGYRVYPGKDRRQFQRLGLRPGDIITAVNGTALTNPTQGAQIFSALGSAQSVSVTLERNGSPQTLTLDVNQLDISNQKN